MRAAAAVAAIAPLAAALGLSAGALAQRAAPAPPPPGPPPEDALMPEEGVLAPRQMEILAGTTATLDDNRGELHFRAGLIAEMVPWVFREAQLLRFGVYQAVTVGAWGDPDHGGVTWGGGARIRLSLLPSDVVDLYALAGGGALYGSRDGGHAGAQVNEGAGFRVFRAISGEILAEHLFAVGGDFRSPAGPQRVAHGANVGVAFDFCSLGTWCQHRPLTQERDNRTCCVYDDALALCERAAGPPRQRLCAAVEAALQVSEHPLQPNEDSFAAFVRAVAEEIRGPVAGPPEPGDGAMAAAIDRLRERHLRLMRWREEGQEQERLAARYDRTLRVRRLYAPYPTDLLQALGCSRADAVPAGAPPAPSACRDVCDERPPRGAHVCDAPPSLR